MLCHHLAKWIKQWLGVQEYRSRVLSLLLPWLPYLGNQDDDTEHVLYFGKNCKCQLVVQHKGLKVMLTGLVPLPTLSGMLNVNFKINGE